MHGSDRVVELRTLCELNRMTNYCNANYIQYSTSSFDTSKNNIEQLERDHEVPRKKSKINKQATTLTKSQLQTVAKKPSARLSDLLFIGRSPGAMTGPSTRSPTTNDVLGMFEVL